MDGKLPEKVYAPIKNVKVSKNAFVSLDEYGFTIILRNYDVPATILSGHFGNHGDWTIEDLVIAATRVKTIKEALKDAEFNKPSAS